jgi:hypothetical protein
MKHRLCRFTWGASAPRFLRLVSVPSSGAKAQSSYTFKARPDRVQKNDCSYDRGRAALQSRVSCSKSDWASTPAALILALGALTTPCEAVPFPSCIQSGSFATYAAIRFLLSSFLSTRMPLSTCFSSSMNGGRKRTTVSCVLLNRTPSASAASTIGRAGMSN